MAGRDKQSQDSDAIDLERVVVDPDYRRCVLALLRAEAARDDASETTPMPAHSETQSA